MLLSNDSTSEGSLNNSSSAVRNSLLRLISAYNGKDAETVKKLTLPDVGMFWPDGTNLSVGIELEDLKKSFESGLYYALTLKKTEVTVYGEVALLTGYVSGEIVLPPKEKKTLHGPWRISCSMIHQNGVWLLADMHLSDAVRLNYLIHLPKGYSENPNKKWPFILYLHGAGERGNNLELLKVYGIPKITSETDDFEFITVSPQCPNGPRWKHLANSIDALLDEVILQYNIDTNRMYLTGASMGGAGSWEYAKNYPERFAAIATMCSGGIPQKAHLVKDIPAWIFHGDQDTTVPIEIAQEMVDALEKCGGKVRFTVCQGQGHSDLVEVFNHRELYDWFLQNSLPR